MHPKGYLCILKGKDVSEWNIGMYQQEESDVLEKKFLNFLKMVGNFRDYDKIKCVFR